MDEIIAVAIISVPASAENDARMSEVKARLEEGLKGKRLQDCSQREATARMQEANAKVSGGKKPAYH